MTTLPTWFGIPASVEDYVDVADRSPTVIASLHDEDIGLLTLVRHSRYAAEVYVMAVLPKLHRQGVGRELLEHAEGVLAEDGVEFLQVKTLAPSKPDDGYEKTRAFYLAYGFDSGHWRSSRTCGTRRTRAALLERQAWANARDTVLTALSLPEDPDELLAQHAETLDRAYRDFAAGVADYSSVSIDDENDLRHQAPVGSVRRRQPLRYGRRPDRAS